MPCSVPVVDDDRRVRKLASSVLQTLDLEPAAMAEGNSKRGIAEAFVITEPTVEKHITRICNKLGLHTRPPSAGASSPC